ncbi:hypothetical protein L2U69_10545 [Zavarzinia compransoris]|nr:hypothetical protein [Zavarzinia marina]MCF4166082.1 hypothetical protein [Zavarzinia marina]
MLAYLPASSVSLSGYVHQVVQFIDTGPGYVVTVTAVFLIWLAWRSFM